VGCRDWKAVFARAVGRVGQMANKAPGHIQFASLVEKGRCNPWVSSRSGEWAVVD
jgi:hypothetical protein